MIDLEGGLKTAKLSGAVQRVPFITRLARPALLNYPSLNLLITKLIFEDLTYGFD